MDNLSKALLGLTLALLVARTASAESLFGLLGDLVLSLSWVGYGVFHLGRDHGWWR